MPTAEQEVHGADSSLGLGRQLASNTASVNVAYGKEHFQTIVRQSIGSKLYICWDNDTSSVVEDVVLNPDASVCTLATVSRSASCDNLRALASMPFFSSVNSDGEESVIETPSQAVIRTKLVEDPVSESQAEVSRTPSIPPAISDLDVASLVRTETVVRQATVELEGPRPSLFSSTHSETGNYLLSLPESYVPVRVDGFFALQQAVENMSLMHAPVSYSLDSVPDAATSGSLQAAVDDDAKSQPAVAPPSSPSPSRGRKASYAPPLQPEEAHTPATTRSSPSRNTAYPGKRAPRVGANPSVRPSPSKHAKDLRSSPPALKRQQQKEQGSVSTPIWTSHRGYGSHPSPATVKPRSSLDILRELPRAWFIPNVGSCSCPPYSEECLARPRWTTKTAAVDPLAVVPATPHSKPFPSAGAENALDGRKRLSRQSSKALLCSWLSQTLVDEWARKKSQ
ncbi:hypothetical protein F5146DRAFT_704963 [Armillaria mellea]|nr:hypothetical protein F5146DRAFT_704963 [Armillaria mellea]